MKFQTIALLCILWPLWALFFFLLIPAKAVEYVLRSGTMFFKRLIENSWRNL
jgi:hypothetical protein